MSEVAVSPVIARCPLCETAEGVALAEVEYREIWHRLAAERGARISAGVIDRHTPAERTELVECARCALLYFSPSIPGDAEFYSQLTPSDYYERDRWEFGEVERRLGPEDSVLDIGCGRGDFLRRIVPKVRRAVGVDHNRDAISRLSESGIEAHAGLEELSAAEQGNFSVVCIFQTLEHVASVRAVLGSAREMLAPGGRLLASVPNRDRFGAEPAEPFDCPPHHVSRWQAAQFAAIAEEHQLELAGVSFEEPDFSAAERWRFERIARVGRRFLGSRGAELAARAHRRYWMNQRRHQAAARRRKYTARGVYGHTMLAEWRLP